MVSRFHSYSSSDENGFSLVELLVVIAIIGLMASIALPNYAEHRRKAFIAETAADLRGFGIAFIAYEGDNGAYPLDNHQAVPPGMENLISTSVFMSTTPLGGRYNWEGPNNYPYAGIGLDGHTATTEDLEALDRMLDNGVLNSGRFRIGTGGRPTYIIEDGI